MKESKVIIVEGKEYTVKPFYTSEGLILLTEISLLVGEPLINLALQMKKGEKKVSELEFDVSSVMAGLTSRLKPESVDQLFQKILKNTMLGKSSNPLDYDSHFIGQYGHLFKVVGKSLEAQYGDFLDALKGLVKKLPSNQQP